MVWRYLLTLYGQGVYGHVYPEDDFSNAFKECHRSLFLESVEDLLPGIFFLDLVLLLY